MPSHHFTIKLSTIVGNINLSESIRYDLICRLVANELELNSVTLLIYHAVPDKLKCVGRYLNPDEYTLLSKDNLINDVVTYLPCFEFFWAKDGVEMSNLTVQDFLQSDYYFENTKCPLEEEFLRLRDNWFQVFKPIYLNYQATLHDEFHSIDETSISGSEFKKLLNDNKINFNPITDKMSNGPQAGKAFLTPLNKIGFNVDISNYYYIGLPLYVNQKYIGLLRLTVVDNNCENNKFGELIFHKDLQSEIAKQLNIFGQILSLNLKANFFLDSFRKINNLIIDKDGDTVFNNKEINDAANSICDLVNCHACLIRFQEGIEERPFPIRGFSDEMAKYDNYVAENEIIRGIEFSKFSEDIDKIFFHEKHEGKEILAINFTVTPEAEFFFNTCEYYYSDNILKYTIVDNRKLRDFDSTYVKDLVDMKMCEIVVLKIDKPERGGYIVVVNTRNKRFTATDIEILLLAVKKIGQEIKNNIELQKSNEAKKQKLLLTSMRIVVHQVGTSLGASFSNIQNFSEGRMFPKTWSRIEKDLDNELSINSNDAYRIIKKADEIGVTLKQAMRQIERSRRIYELFENPIEPIFTQRNNVESYLRNICREFDSLAQRKKDVKVWLFRKEDAGAAVNTDFDLLDEVLFNFLDNAIKYSFHRTELNQKNIEYIEGNMYSPGNISVRYWNTFSYFKIEVENWGKVILLKDRPHIFNLFKRGSDTSGILGSGIGLFLAKKIVESLGGIIEVHSANHKTIFTLTLKK